MSEPHIIGERTPSGHSLSPSPIDTSVKLQSHAQPTRRESQKLEQELKKAKRKSNAYMAAEAVQHELDAVTALKRLSIGRSSINIDPDLPFGVDGDFNYNDYSSHSQHRRKSSQESSSSSSSLDDRDKTLIDDMENDEAPDDESDENLRLNAEKLLWVPAKSHPSIAPDQFRRHVQSTIDDMNNQLGDRSPVNSLSTKDSIPSLKELTDELDRLSEMAGLAATDAVTLARSLSSASGSSSSLLLNTEDNKFFQEATVTPPQDTTTPVDRRPSQEDIDQDAPILSDGSSSLKRNKWTTYSRSNRLGKDKVKKSPRSPLSDDHQSPSQPNQPSTSPNLEKQLPPSPRDNVPERTIPLQDPKEQQKLAEQRGRSNLSRSQSDTLPKRTNHSRNRHAGSLISIENGQQKQQQPSSSSPSSSSSKKLQEHHKYQRRVVSNDSYPKSHSNLYQVQQSSEPTGRSAQLTSKENTQPAVSHQDQTQPQPQPEKSKKDNSFLKMFKKKRSPSPKNQKQSDTRKISSSKSQGQINDENHPPTSQDRHVQQQQQVHPSVQKLHHGQTPPPQQQEKRPSLKSSRSSNFKFSKQSKGDPNGKQHLSHSKESKLQESVKIVPQKKGDTSPTSPMSNSPTSSHHQQTGQAINEEQHRIQKETLSKKLSLENMKKSTKPNAPVQFTDSAFGFPLPPLSHSTIIMLDYRFPIHVERALYRLSHLKLANPRRPLRQQVLLSNFMYAYLNLVNHTLYLQQLDENADENAEDDHELATGDVIEEQEQISIEV